MSLMSQRRVTLNLLDLARSAVTYRPEDVTDDMPHDRWLILEPDGQRKGVCALPEMTRAELAPCYPEARLLPLPDSGVEPGPMIHQTEPSL